MEAHNYEVELAVDSLDGWEKVQLKAPDLVISDVAMPRLTGFELLERIRFPASHRLVVCNSFVQAKKAAGVKAAFNARVASYLLGVQLVRLHFPRSTSGHCSHE